MTPQQEFDAAYKLSLPPKVRALLDMAQDDPARVALAQSLALEGFVIDNAIMVWGWDPYVVMNVRKDLGFTWVPSALQPNVPVTPGLSFPGLPSYDPDHPPAGSIKVSLDLKDYPAFDPPVPVPVPSGDLVGRQALGDLYGSTMLGNEVPDGTRVQQGGVIYVKHVVQGLFGKFHTFQKLGTAPTLN